MKICSILLKLTNCIKLFYNFSTIFFFSLEYVQKLQKHIERLKDRDQFPIILVGNKSDLKDERQANYLYLKYFKKNFLD